MAGIPKALTGTAAPQGGLIGGGLPWAIGSAEVEVSGSGKVEVAFRHLKFDPSDPGVIAAGLDGGVGGAPVTVPRSARVRDDDQRSVVGRRFALIDDVPAADRNRPSRFQPLRSRLRRHWGRVDNGSVSVVDPMISVKDLWKVYGPRAERIVGSADADLPRGELQERFGNVVAMREVNLDVAPGEVFVVMGLSGSGKSTLIRCLTRLIEPTAGQVIIHGADVTAASDDELLHVRRHKVSMVFQHFGLLPHRTLLDNVAFGLELRGVNKAQRRETAARTLELVGLPNMGGYKPHQLSGGQQQRVGLARALATDPDIMLFDEPFSALDPLIRREMQDEIVRLRREVSKTMVFITHDLSEALRLGDRIAIMRDGRFVQVGTPAEVVLEPADEYVANFVRDVPRSHVVPVDAVMIAPTDGPFAGEVQSGSKVRDAVSLVARSDLPVRVVQEGRTVGTLDRVAVLSVIATEDI